jgi:hypothetical protein
VAKYFARLHKIYIPLFTALALLVPFAVYREYYVHSQEEYLKDRSFRVLAAMGDQLAGRVDHISEVVRASVRFPGDRNDYLNLYLKDVLFNKTYISSGFDESKGPTVDVDLQLITGNQNLELVFYLHGTGSDHASESSDVASKSACSEAARNSICVRTALDGAMRTVFGRVSDEFDEVLIADPEGHVVFQQSPSNLRILNLQNLVLAGNKDTGDKKSAADAAKDCCGKPAAKTGPGSSSFHAKSEASNIVDIKLAGTDYKLFLQPLILSRENANDSHNLNLVIGGLQKAEQLSSQSYALPYPTLIKFSLIFLTLGSLSWPLMKVNLMSASERLRPKHRLYLLLSTVFATASCTLIILNVSYAEHQRSQVSDQLKQISKTIQNNVAQEIGMALDEMKALSDDKQFMDRPLADDTPPDEKSWTRGNNFLLKTSSNNPYPYFDNAFWVNAAGNQVHKVSVQSQITPRTSVVDWEFFNNVMRGRFAQPPPNTSYPFPYCLQIRYSPNSGMFQVVVAAPFEDKIAKGENTRIRVQALATSFLSLVDPVLPPGYGFAILQDDGKVLFHSSSVRNLRENFLLECKERALITAAMFSGSDQYLQAAYMGRAHDIYLTKVRGLGAEPVTLAVFHDTSAERTFNLAMMLLTALLLGIAAIPGLILIAILQTRERAYPANFIWPQERQTGTYLHLFLANCMLLAQFLFLYKRLYNGQLLILTGAVTLTAIAFAVLKLLRKPIHLRVLSFCLMPLFATSGDQLWKAGFFLAAIGCFLSFTEVSHWLQERTGRFFKPAYAAVVVSLLASVVIVPCFGIFKYSYDSVNRLALRHQQLTLLKSLLQRSEKIERYYLDIKTAEKYGEGRLKVCLDRYDTVFFNTGFDCLKGDPSTRFDSSHALQEDLIGSTIAKCTWLLPSNRLGVEMSRLAEAYQDIDQSWKEVSPHTSVLNWAPRIAFKNVTVASDYPDWTGLSPGCTLFLFIIVAALGTWLFNLMKKVFLPDMEDVPPLPPVDWHKADQIDGNYIVIGHPMSGRTDRLQGLLPGRIIDLRTALQPLVGRSDWKLDYPKDATLAVDHFEWKIDDPASNQTRLELLEKLLYEGNRKVVIVSTVDPLHYFREEAAEILVDGTPSNASVHWLDRWTAVLKRFKNVEFKDYSRIPFAAAIKMYAKDPRMVPIIKLVESECDWTANLRRVGTSFLKNYDPAKQITRKAFEQRLLDTAGAYYGVLWSTFTQHERMVLYQLARDGWANPKNGLAIQQLRRKEIICKRVMFRVMNDSFRQFIRSVDMPNDIAKWEQEQQASLWQAFKLAIMTTLAILFIWLLYAQKDLFQVSIGYMVAVGGALTAVVNFLSSVRGKSPITAKPSQG